MSKIYEALQRADLERKLAEEAEARAGAEPPAVSEPSAVSTPAEPSLVLPNYVHENIALHAWKPVTVALPTLGERGPGVEQFRNLRSHLYQLREQTPLKTILVCSGMPGEGKTFVTANLALSLARNKANSILLIDCDLRRSSLHNMLGAPNKPGLTEYLSGSAELNDIMQRDRNPEVVETGSVPSISNLTFIPAGTCGDNSSELLANRRLDDLIATLSPHFDWILIDSPPVLAVTDAVDLARVVDGVLLVAREASTPYDVAQRTQAAFHNFRILGFVLNAVKHAERNGSYYYYYGKK